jgi:hypothetical protein
MKRNRIPHPPVLLSISTILPSWALALPSLVIDVHSSQACRKKWL